MNKYVVPIFDGYIPYIIIMSARSIDDCKDKFMTKYFTDYSESFDWDDYKDDLYDNHIIIGKIQDIEEL